MKTTPAFTLKIVHDDSILESFNQQNPLSETQKELIRFIVQETVLEILKVNNAGRANPTQDLDPNRIIRLPEVVRMVGLKHASIYRYISEGKFPQQIQLGRRSVGWRYREIAEWLNRK